MSVPNQFSFLSGLVLIAMILVLAVPAAAVRMSPDADDAFSSSICSHSAENHMLSQESSDCQNNCYRLCALTCTDGWCMIGCMRNCDRYCSKKDHDY